MMVKWSRLAYVYLIIPGVFLAAIGERIFSPLIFQVFQLLLQQPRHYGTQ